MASIGWSTLLAIGVGSWIAFWAAVHTRRALLRRRGGQVARELGLGVSAGEKRARRGGEVEAVVTISSAKELGEVEVGLVCTEFYDEASDGEPHSYPVTCQATAFETWVPVGNRVGSQSVRLPIPAEAPFSYAGDCLSFKWEVAARGRRAGSVDAEARSEVFVLP